MGVGALDGNVEKLTAEYVGGADASADDGSSCAVNAGVRSLGAAQTKFHDAVALCSIADACSFGGN